MDLSPDGLIFLNDIFMLSNHLIIAILEIVQVPSFGLLILLVEKVYELLDRFPLLDLLRKTTIFLDFIAGQVPIGDGLLIGSCPFFKMFSAFMFVLLLLRDIALVDLVDDNLLIEVLLEKGRERLCVASRNLLIDHTVSYGSLMSLSKGLFLLDSW